LAEFLNRFKVASPIEKRARPSFLVFSAERSLTTESGNIEK
jgi:hypothetical protein